MISTSTEYLTYYPTNYSVNRGDGEFAGFAAHARPTSLYVHVPFCRAICPFCNYNKFELGADQPEKFIATLVHELQLWHEAGVDFTHLRVLYVGGGTPSVISSAGWGRFVMALRSLAPNITCFGIECHPTDGTTPYLRELFDVGFNRVSFGTQSFSQNTLTALGSHHDVATSLSCPEAARSAGFEDVALDLLFLVPGQDEAAFEADVRRSIELPATHISTYRLLLDPAAPLGRRIRLGRSAPQPLKLERAMASMALDLLGEAGWNHYGSCSSTGFDFALPGFESAYEVEHRAAPQGDLLAIGTGASGYLNGRGYWTTHTFPEYVSTVEQGSLPALCWTPASDEEARRRYAVLGVKHLRLPLQPYASIHGTELTDDFTDEVSELVREELAYVEDGELVLSREGILRLDGISKLFHSVSCREWDQPYRPELQMLSLDLADPREGSG